MYCKRVVDRKSSLNLNLKKNLKCHHVKTWTCHFLFMKKMLPCKTGKTDAAECFKMPLFNVLVAWIIQCKLISFGWRQYAKTGHCCKGQQFIWWIDANWSRFVTCYIICSWNNRTRHKGPQIFVFCNASYVSWAPMAVS